MPQPQRVKIPAHIRLFAGELKGKDSSPLMKPDLSVAHARALVTEITQNNDGAHAEQLLELIHGIADPSNIVAVEVEKQLYSLTSDFQSHFSAYLSKLKAA